VDRGSDSCGSVWNARGYFEEPREMVKFCLYHIREDATFGLDGVVKGASGMTLTMAVHATLLYC